MCWSNDVSSDINSNDLFVIIEFKQRFNRECEWMENIIFFMIIKNDHQWKMIMAGCPECAPFQDKTINGYLRTVK